jgi:hypothetical protein
MSEQKDRVCIFGDGNNCFSYKKRGKVWFGAGGKTTLTKVENLNSISSNYFSEESVPWQN